MPKTTPNAANGLVAMPIVGHIGDVGLRDPEVTPHQMPATVHCKNNIPSRRRHGDQQGIQSNEMTCENRHNRLAVSLSLSAPQRGAAKSSSGNRYWDARSAPTRRAARAVLLREIRQEVNHDHVPKHIDQRDGVDRDQRANRRSGLGRHPHTHRDLGLAAGLRIINVMTAQNAKMTLAIRNSAR